MRLRCVLGVVCVRRVACLTCRGPWARRRWVSTTAVRLQGTRNSGDNEAAALAARGPEGGGHVGSGGKRAARRTRSARSRTLDFTGNAEVMLEATQKKRPKTPALDALGLLDEGPGRAAAIGAALSQMGSSAWAEAIVDLVRLEEPALAVDLLEARKADLVGELAPAELGEVVAALSRGSEFGAAEALGRDLFGPESTLQTLARPSRIYASLVSALLKKQRLDHAEGLALAWSAAERRVAADAEGAVVVESPPPAAVFNNALRAARRSKSLRCVFALLEAMLSAGVAGDDETFAEVSNAAARSVDFVKGAVSLETMPPADRGEALLMGRSNVGKSSLVNMLCNRKGVAFTSKTPGKTQEFNYFQVNGNDTRKSGLGWRPPGEFYLVDVPGLGYAKMPAAMRNQWKQLLTEYLETRANLRVVFHLVDARLAHLQQTDYDLLDLVRSMLADRPWRYVIVLTKADKVDKTSDKRIDDAAENVQAELEKHLGPDLARRTPILVTSSVTKRGRDAMWRELSRAALDNGDM